MRIFCLQPAVFDPECANQLIPDQIERLGIGSAFLVLVRNSQPFLRVGMQDLECPPWIDFPRIQFPRTIQNHCSGGDAFHELFGESASVLQLGRPDGGKMPLWTFRLGRYECWLAAHRENDLLTGQRLLDMLGNLRQILFHEQTEVQMRIKFAMMFAEVRALDRAQYPASACQRRSE